MTLLSGPSHRSKPGYCGKPEDSSLNDFKMFGSVRSTVLLACFLSLILLGCGGGEEGSPAQVAESDSALEKLQAPALDGEATPRTTSPRLSHEEQTQQPLRVSEMGYDRGDPDAPVKVLEISDFGCGYCRLFHEETFPELQKIYIAAGLVEWKFIPFVLGRFPNGLEAAMAAECAGEQDRFFPMQSRLFLEQRAWRTSQDPNDFFSSMAADEGLDVNRFESCLEGGWQENSLRANIRLGQQAGARGTPYFIVDGRPVQGARPLDEFRGYLDAALLQKGIDPPRR